MSEPEAEPSPSLIEQRMALERMRTISMILTLVFGINSAWRLFDAIFDDGGGVSWGLGAVFGVLLALSVIILIGAQRKIRAFQDRYGVDAGKRK